MLTLRDFGMLSPNGFGPDISAPQKETPGDLRVTGRLVGPLPDDCSLAIGWMGKDGNGTPTAPYDWKRLPPEPHEARRKTAGPVIVGNSDGLPCGCRGTSRGANRPTGPGAL